MRLRWTVASLAWSMLALAPGARADDVEAQLRQMQDHLQSLEDRLQATSDELKAANERVEAQEHVIHQAGLAEGSLGASSGVAAFLESLEIGGWVAASYNYNLEGADGDVNGGFNGGVVPAYPFHPDTNSFSLDQFWLELERTVNEEQRAGFRVDLVYGKTAELLNANEGVNPDGFSGSDEDFELYQAYIQYLAPIGEGVNFQFGKFATVIGAEVAQSPYNFNITRGHVYNLFQPITHVGVLASTDWGEGFSTALGLVNETRSFPGADIDINSDKAALWSLGWANDEFSMSFNGTHGDSDSGQGVNTKSGDKETILDLIFGWDPTDDFSTYINADFISSENSASAAVGTLTGEFDGYGVAWAGRYAMTERVGAALRAEWVSLAFDCQGCSDVDQEIWGLTGTIDYLLTSNLMLRAELRYDNLRSGDTGFRNNFFRNNGLLREDDQTVGLIEAIYSFNGF